MTMKRYATWKAKRGLTVREVFMEEMTSRYHNITMYRLRLMSFTVLLWNDLMAQRSDIVRVPCSGATTSRVGKACSRHRGSRHR